MTPTLRPPRKWRIAAAFLLAPALASLLLASLGPLYAGLPNWADRVFRTAHFYALFYAYPMTVLLGLPIYILLRPVVHTSLVRCISVGAGIAALPMLLLGACSNPDYAYSNGHVTHQNGFRTLDGWMDLAVSVGFIAVLGAFAGIVFWIVAAAGVTTANGEATGPENRRPVGLFGSKRQKRLFALSFFAVLVLLIALELWRMGYFNR